MTDRDIIDVFNGILAAQEQILAASDKTVTEEPPGKKRIRRVASLLVVCTIRPVEEQTGIGALGGDVARDFVEEQATPCRRSA